jgi:hypothetical protein
MSIFTEQEFRNIASQKAGNIGLKGIVNETRTFSKSVSTTSLFLSHSHHDKSKIEQAKIFFENLGISIYVDWADKTMPESTNGITAQKIKNQIISGNDKFVLLATNNAVVSKWCNWEVGIADPFKLSKDKIAILPLADNNRYWTGNEYLQIYPSIEYVNENNRNNLGLIIPHGYYVKYPSIDGSRRYESLETWLRK